MTLLVKDSDEIDRTGSPDASPEAMLRGNYDGFNFKNSLGV
jgi:hypothetical protein